MAAGPERHTDLDLLRQLAVGKEAAFNELYDRHQQSVYRFALYCAGNAELAEEVTQDVFLRLIRAPRQYDPDRASSLQAYLCGEYRKMGCGRNGCRQYGGGAFGAQPSRFDSVRAEYFRAATGRPAVGQPFQAAEWLLATAGDSVALVRFIGPW